MRTTTTLPGVAILRRLSLLMVVSFLVAGCELIGDIFQAGFVIGIVIVLVIVAVVGWIISRFRRG
ncbi:MAG TPA: hypothetical protein VHG09_07530 [Longimicrobiales bacterium]|nr:hypothetical protein [Longimicrobiales bacterium]